MRKLVSKHEIKKQRRKNQVIVGGVLVFLMIVSTLGFAFQGGLSHDNSANSEGGIVNYNGYEFVNSNGLWVLGNFAFRNNPQQVENISSNINNYLSYREKPVYIYSEYEAAEIDVYTDMNQIAQRVQNACLSKEECNGDYPIKSCTDNFIIIKKSDNISIRQEDNCVYIEGPEEKLTGLADLFLFKVLGIK